MNYRIIILSNVKSEVLVRVRTFNNFLFKFVKILIIPIFSPNNVGWGWGMVWLIKENNQLQSGTP
jgi:hypothetical protein